MYAIFFFKVNQQCLMRNFNSLVVRWLLHKKVPPQPYSTFETAIGYEFLTDRQVKLFTQFDLTVPYGSELLPLWSWGRRETFHHFRDRLLNGCLTSGTIPRISENWRLESATRSLLRMQNLAAVRGVPGASMVGPVDYLGNLEDPHKYLYTITDQFPPQFYRKPISDQDKKITSSLKNLTLIS
jgi:hypothetical protein